MAFVGFEAGGLPGDPYSQHFYAPAAYGYYAAPPAAAPPMPAGALAGRSAPLEGLLENKGRMLRTSAVTGSSRSFFVAGAAAPTGTRLPAR